MRGEIEELRFLLLGAGAIAPETALNDGCERLWELRRKFSESLKSTGLTKLNEDVVVPRGRLVDLIDFAAGLQSRRGVPVACFGHAGDGNIHVNLMVANYDQPAVRVEMGGGTGRALRPKSSLGEARSPGNTASGWRSGAGGRRPCRRRRARCIAGSRTRWTRAASSTRAKFLE